MTRSTQWGLVWLVLSANLLIALWNAINPVHRGTMLVLTPMVDVVPNALALTPAERRRLDASFAEYDRALQSQDVAQAFAILGASLTIHDLVRGIALIEDSPLPLSTEQRSRVKTKLEDIGPANQTLLDVQKRLILLEEEIASELHRLESQ